MLFMEYEYIGYKPDDAITVAYSFSDFCKRIRLAISAGIKAIITVKSKIWRGGVNVILPSLSTIAGDCTKAETTITNTKSVLDRLFQFDTATGSISKSPPAKATSPASIPD